MYVLEYTRWDKFTNIINKAIIACEASKNEGLNHLSHVGKTISMPKNATKTIDDYKLSRYACYLIIQNADLRSKLP